MEGWRAIVLACAWGLVLVGRARAQDAAEPATPAVEGEIPEPFVEELDTGVEDPARALADPARDLRPVSPPPPWGAVLLGIQWRPHLEVRERLEVRAGSYVPGLRDSALVTSRARVGLDARWQSLRGFLQIQDVRDLGVAPGGTTGVTTGVHQGFAQVGDDHSFVRVGRQEIDWGSGRLIGSLNWQSAARSFDALRLRGEILPFAVEAMVTLLRPPRQFTYTRTHASGDTETWGADSGGDWLAGMAFEWMESEALRLSTFVLYRHDGPLEPSTPGLSAAERDAAPTRQRDIAALSVRAAGRLVGRLRYELELIGEAGVVSHRDFFALAGIAEAHYAIEAPWQPEIGLGASIATGNGGGSVREFENFFASNHVIYGLMDIFGLRNQAQAFVRAGVTPDARIGAWIAARLFWLLEPGARWTNAPGQTIAIEPSNREPFLGAELDVEVRWTPIDHLPLSAGYAVFVPAGGAVALGHADPMHFFYVMGGVLFP